MLIISSFSSDFLDLTHDCHNISNLNSFQRSLKKISGWRDSRIDWFIHRF